MICKIFGLTEFNIIFYPNIYDSDNTILTIYYDFFLDENDKTYGKKF